MRQEQELIDQVDVHARTIEARHRLRPANGQQQGILLPAVGSSPTWWDRLKPESLIVATREVKGFVVPHWAAAVILAAMLTSMGFMYSRFSDQRDILIRLTTQLEERDKHELEYRSEFKTKLNVQQLQIDNATNQLGQIKLLLSPAQVRSIEHNSRKADQ